MEMKGNEGEGWRECDSEVHVPVSSPVLAPAPVGEDQLPDRIQSFGL